MADTSTSEPAPHTNGLVDAAEDDERGKQRPADIDADMREMERRKRVELIMNSRLFREELERIIETQIKDGGAGTSHLLQQISDMMGVPKHANVFKGPNCVVPINDIRGVESMGYAKGEKLLRCKLACVYRLLDLYGWSKGVSNQVTARLNQDQEHFLVNPYGMLCHEITASSLVKIDMQGNVVEQGTTNFGVNLNAFSLHAAIHAARPDVKCAVHVHTPAVMAVSALKCGLLPISQESVVVGEVSTHPYSGGLAEPEEREKVARNLGPINKILLLANHGAVCCGETIEEAFFNIHNLILACETQLKLMPVGIDNLVLVSEETRKQMYEAARRAPDGTASRTGPPEGSVIAEKLAERKWRVGGTDFEALMRMLDNAGFRTGYIYRHPLIKGEPPRPRNDCEVPPAVSSLGYLLEEEEMYKQGIWKHGRKGNDRTRWLNSPNVYQKVEILETGTPDPKKITKWVDANADEWVADGSPTHSSTPVKIDAALQFVPKNTNPKEFKKLQQQIKDNRRADKISAGPQSHILEGVTWEEAKKMQDAGVTQTGDQVVVVGAASKGIIQRGFQHHAMVYKAPYAKNPFDSVTDEELDEYKKVIEKKAKGEYDTDFSESEGLSSAQISKQVDELNLRSPTSATSETEEESRDEPRVLRIETKHAPKPSQPEVVLSDESDLSTLDRKKPPIPPRKPRDDEHASALLLNSERSHQQATANFNQSYKGLKNGAGLPAFYRTCSHAGMPKGSFISPQPKHYHVQGGFSLAEMRAHPLFQRKMQQNKPQISLTSNTNIDVNINPSPKPLSINLPLNTIKEFITPFNRALGLETNRADKIFEKVQNYIETDSENLYEYDFTERSNDRSVLRKQRDMVMRDINSNVALLELDSSFSDVEVVENEISDHENPNTETEVIDFAKKITKYNFENTSSTAIPTVSIWDEICKHPTVISKYTENLQDIFALPKTPEEPNDSDEYTEFKLPSPDRQQEMVTLENESINASGDSILKCVLEISKGTILDSANTCEKFDEIWPDKNCVSVIKQISRLIYKFIMQVCVETLEALEFPDIRCYHDAEDFFDSILVIFEKYLDLFPEDEDLKKLKQCVMNSVIRCMEKYFVIIPVTKDNLIDKKIANKKVFALKKFLSVLIYILFDKIENPDYQCTHYDMPDLNINGDDIKYHSTPESCDLYYTLSESSGGGDNSSSSQESKNEASEITSFLTQKSEKSGSSSYWFMLNDKVSPLKRCSSMINSKSPPEVAEKMRRLSAPARMSYDIPRALSPIPEEPRKSLLIELSEDEYSFNSETFILSGSENSLAETEYQTVQEQTPSPTENPFPTENHKVVFQNQVTFVIKPNIKTDYEAARSETSLTFVPDDNITAQLQALSLESDFDTNSYISAQSLTEDEGDWMGLASAQF